MDIVEKLQQKDKLYFNEEQMKILDHRIGPAAIESTAGSGKTTIICTKIGILIDRCHIDPQNILVLTYSNASVNDISNRFRELMIGKIHSDLIAQVKFSTVHSFAMSIISHYSWKTGIKYRVAGNEGQQNINSMVSGIFEEIYNRQPQIAEIDRIISGISLLNNKGSNINTMENSNIDNLGYIYRKYQEYKQDKGIIDYDDMIVLSIKLLKENLALREHFQKKYEYILLDEAQDMSKLQYELLKLVANRFENLVILGDSDQSIYSFRGSYKNIFADFYKDFPSAKRFNLGVNYRCPRNIVEVSSQFIEVGDKRTPKEITSFKKEDGMIKILNFENDEEQNRFIVNEIMDKYLDELDQTVILFRDSLSSIKLICNFINKEINFFSNISEYRFFRHFTKNDIVAATWLSYERNILLAFYQFYNKINLNLNKGDILKIKDNQYNNEDIFHCFRRIGGFTNKQRELMEELEKKLDYLATLKPYDVIDYFLYEMGYKEYLDNLTRGIGYENSIYFRYIEIMRYLTKNEPSIRTYINWVARLQLRVQESLSNKGKNAVTLSTLHSSKGLEYNNVFIIDINKGILPAYTTEIKTISSFYGADIEEERRLTFVGMTRAKKNLYLLSSGVRSQYLDEIDSIIDSSQNT